MQTEFLIPLVLLIPLVAGFGLLVWSFLGPQTYRLSNFWTVLGGGAFLSLGSLTGDWIRRQSDPNLSTGLVGFFQKLPILQPDWLSTSWCALSGISALLILHWPRHQLPVASFREAFAGLWLFAAGCLVISSDRIWLQWGGIVISGWLLCLILARNEQDQPAFHCAGICLLWFTVADFLGLFAMLYFQQVWFSPSISEMSNYSQLASLSGEQIALTVTGQTYLLVSLLLRCGLFPLMSWTRFAAIGCRDVAWMTVFGVGLSGAMVLKCSQMLNAFDEIHLLLVGLSMLSIVLLGLLAAFGTRGPRRMLTLASIQIAIACIGVSAPTESMNLAALLAGLSSLFLISMLSLSLEQLSSGERSLAGLPGSVLLIAILLCCGFLGQEQLSVDVWSALWGPSFSPAVLLGTILTGQFLTTFALYRELSRPEIHASVGRQNVTIPHYADLSRWGWIAFGILAVLGVVVLWGNLFLFQSPEQIRPLVSVPIVMTLLMLIGVVNAGIWPDIPVRKGPTSLRGNVLQRMTQNDYYLPLLIGAITWFPTWSFSLFSRFLDRFVLTAWFHWIPRLLTRQLAVAANLTDEETSETQASKHLIAAALIMLAGIGLSTLI